MWKKISSEETTQPLVENSVCPSCGRGWITPDELHPGWIWCSNCGKTEESN